MGGKAGEGGAPGPAATDGPHPGPTGDIRFFVEASPMGVHQYRMEADRGLVFTGANPAADAILGVDNRQFVGRRIEEAFPALARTDIPESYRRVCETGVPWHSEQVLYEDERIRGAFEVHAFRSGPGTMLALFLDITERKRAEKALRDSEEKYRLLVENAGDGIFIARDGKVVFANRRAVEMAGHEREEEVAGRSFLDFIAPADWDLVKERHARRVRGENVPSTYELRMRRSDGEEFRTQLNSVLITWQGRPATLNFIRDVSALRRVEARLAQVERMRSIGNLAGGVAHDFNNILMVIQGNASLLLNQMGPDHPFRERVRSIEEAVESGTDLTRQILGFARGGKYLVAPADLNDLVRRSVQMFGRARKEVAVHLRLAGDLRVVEIDRGQIEQALLNIFVNAWQSMAAGGEIYVETANEDLDAARAAAVHLGAGRFVRVAVRDTGQGMDEPTRARVFEPFFTTKEMGRGTGLGLASVYGIVKNHGGSIGVESEPGSGSSFTILLPASEKELPRPEPAAASLRRGRGLVLLVDDEPPVAGAARGMLEHLGYEVITAGSGPEALEAYRRERERIALVVLDMVMPGMGGGETYDRLREIDPRVRVLVSSGYSLDGKARELLARGCRDFIQKPYSVAELSRKLHALADRGAEVESGAGTNLELFPARDLQS